MSVRVPRRRATATRAAFPIDGRTRVVAVIGDPIEHSRSPAMHNAAFQALGLPYVYVALRVAPDQIAAAVAAVRALDLVGLNVTIPHKEAVLRHLDRVSAGARVCRAVNTIVNRRGTLLGENTDVVGLERDLVGLGVAGAMKSAVVLGAGGSARAAVVALGKRARRVVIAARRPERARALARELAPAVRAKLVGVPLAELDPAARSSASWLADAAVVVNATPVGMNGEPFVPLAHRATPADCLFYDLVYTVARTTFLRGAARARRPVAGGLGMLLHQGAAAFEIWTGKRAPLEVMRRAIGA